MEHQDNKLHRVISLPPPIALKNAFVNDFAVDLYRNYAFISDPAGGDNAALIVVNLETGLAGGFWKVIRASRRKISI